MRKSSGILCALAAALFPVNVALAQSKPPAKKTARHGDWFAKVLVDKMTDAKECLVLNAKDPYVSVDPVGRLDINYRGRGGIAGYQYRIDSHPASPYQLLPPGRTDVLSVSDVRDEFNTARRLLIQGETVLGRPISLEYDLRGLGAAKEEAAKLCSTS